MAAGCPARTACQLIAVLTVIREAGEIDCYLHDGGRHVDKSFDNCEQVRGHLHCRSIVLIDDIRWWDRRLLDGDPGYCAAWKRIAGDPIVRCVPEVNNGTGIALID